MIQQDPEAELPIDIALIQSLIQEQFPEFSDLPLQFLDSGWDNENYRLGTDYIVRLPRRMLAIQLMANEIQWLTQLAPLLPIHIPAPIRVGQPTTSYPSSWTIIPWFEGDTPNRQAIQDSEALRLAAFLKTLHQLPFENAPQNDHRGEPLSSKIERTEHWTQQLETTTNSITSNIKRFWKRALQAPLSKSTHLLHGDLHPRNIIVKDGRIEAIIDWGDLTSGDPATDLAAFWMLFESPDIRKRALQAYGATTTQIERAIGWAIFFGVILLATGLNSNEQHVAIGRTILNNIDQE